MISEKLFAIRHRLENQLNTSNCIEIDLIGGIHLIDQLNALEELVIQLENSVVPENLKHSYKESSKVISLDNFRAKKKGS